MSSQMDCYDSGMGAQVRRFLRSVARASLGLSVLGATSVANEILPGLPGEHVSAGQNLLVVPGGGLNVTSVALRAPGTELGCFGLPVEVVHFGMASGFAARNGFVISNGYVEDIDRDGPAQGFGNGCVTPEGDVFPPGSNCVSYDLTLSALLGGVATEDTVRMEIDLLASSPMPITLSYNFLTFENPIDPSFFDVFAITLDGQLLAGGSSNAGPMPGTDPWSLAPSSTSPYEYLTVAPSGSHNVPGRETGRRNVEFVIPAGAHTLTFYVADSGPPTLCGLGACPQVHSALFFGLHTFQSTSSNGVGSAVPGLAPRIDSVGHPTASLGQGGYFPADFGVTLAGAEPNSQAFFLQGNGILPGITVPVIAPRELLVGPILVIEPVTVRPNGTAVFPETPPVLDATVYGLTIHFQWFGFDSGGVWNTPGLRVPFGP